MDAQSHTPLEEAGAAERLRLDNQLCFPLYACAKEVVRRYGPALEPLGITYTQYLCMMVLWEEGEASVGGLGERLYLDSGTLTPLLRKLEDKGYVTRERSGEDARVLVVRLTEEGRALRERAKDVPLELERCIDLSPADAQDLVRLLRTVIENVRSS